MYVVIIFFWVPNNMFSECVHDSLYCSPLVRMAVHLHTGTSGEESAEPSFPITLHPPLPPTLTHHTPTINDVSTSPPSNQTISHIPDPVLGPTLVPAAPYSNSQSSDLEPESGSNRQVTVPVSCVHSL